MWRLDGREVWGRIDTCICMAEPLCYSPKTITTLLIGHCCSVAQSCPTLCNPMGCSTPGFPVLRQLPDLSPIHVHWVSDAIQPSHPLLSPSPPTFNLSQQQYFFLMSQLFTSGGHSIGASASASVRTDWFDLLAVQGTLKSLLQHHSSKTSVQCSAFFMV